MTASCNTGCNSCPSSCDTKEDCDKEDKCDNDCGSCVKECEGCEKEEIWICGCGADTPKGYPCWRCGCPEIEKS